MNTQNYELADSWQYDTWQDEAYSHAESAADWFSKAVQIWDRMQPWYSNENDRLTATVAFKVAINAGRENFVAALQAICSETGEDAQNPLDMARNIMNYSTEYSTSAEDLEAIMHQQFDRDFLDLSNSDLRHMNDVYRNAATAALNFDHRLLNSFQLFLNSPEISNKYLDVIMREKNK